jgi:phenylalanyl-tRNA synthetase beta chain
MNASLAWLRDFVDIDMSPAELRDLLTLRCATVDDVVALRQDLADIVVGRVIEAGPHPDSDHLWVTKVDAGEGQLRDVVCGAPNVVVGTLYPFAKVGSTLPGGLKIEKRKIRGATSEGMLCSARELGLGTDHQGILALDVSANPGDRFLDVMPVGDTRFVIDVLPNRPDLLSHHGVAREIAAATGKELRRPIHPPAALTRSAPVTSQKVDVSVEDTDGSPRYMTAVIRGVTVGPSPEWLSSRIEAAGGRSISNVVDVTNYMLHGFGQPMHAFDLAKLGGGKVIVRRARAGEKIQTLDGVDRTLDDSMTVIADAHDAQAIAGVIGGKGSEVSEGTTEILLEVAAFNPQRVRATRRKLGISTDASYRFERGVDREAIPDLLKYAVELITRVAGGVRDVEPTDINSGESIRATISLRPSRVTVVLGQEISVDEITALLSSVGFDVKREGENLSITPPSFRSDVVGEVEVIEEIARLYGYDRFSSEIRPFRPSSVPDAPLELMSRKIREELISAGLYEARPMPFVRTGSPDLRVRNPLAEDEAFLRTSVLDTLARRVEYNFAHMNRNVRLFEIGAVFTSGKSESTGAPLERTRVGAVVAGDRRPAHFTDAKPPQFDQWDAKAIAEAITTIVRPADAVSFDGGAGDTLWVVKAGGNSIGTVQRLTVDAPVWAPPVYGIEIEIDPEAEAETKARRFTGVPVMPAMQVDLALIVPDAVTAEQVGNSIRATAGELLESLEIFDEFRGKGVPEGARSLGWALTFRHPERTLRDREIQGRTSKILSNLEAQFGIRQRTS